MYSEKIDNIIDQLTPINQELRQMNEKMVKDILAIEPGKQFINVMYYTQNGVDAYTFLGIDNDGYGSGLFIGSIDASGKTPVLNMVDEDGDEYEERDISDFLHHRPHLHRLDAQRHFGDCNERGQGCFRL